MASITDALEEHLAALSDGLATACEDAAADVARQIAQRARENCPAQSGRLRQSIAAHTDGTVTASAPYAAAVELGTYRRAASPFLAPALRASAQDVQRLSAQAVLSALKEDA